MKQSLSRIGIVGGVVLFAVLGLSFVHFSSAQTVDSSSSATSTVSSTTSSSSPGQSSLTPSSYLTSSSSADSIQPSPSTSTTSLTPIVVTSTTSSAVSTSTSPQSVSSTDTSTTVATSDTLSVDVSTSSTLNFLASSSASSTGVSSTPPLPSIPPAPVPTGYPTCDQSIKNVPADYPTIQAAINAASIGDTIKIAAGTYNEDVTLASGICLEGAGIDQTIISKSGASGITGNGVSYVIIKDLTVEGSGCAPGVCGGGGDGGGIQLSRSSNITIQSCRFAGNFAVNGGGVSLSHSSVTMDHSIIDGNTANNVGAGIAMDPASTATLTNVTVANNNWVNNLKNGGVGGISAAGSGLQMSNSIVWGNNSQNFSGNGSRISNSDIGGWSGGSNNVTSNPNFVSASDFHLQASSSAAMGAY